MCLASLIPSSRNLASWIRSRQRNAIGVTLLWRPVAATPKWHSTEAFLSRSWLSEQVVTGSLGCRRPCSGRMCRTGHHHPVLGTRSNGYAPVPPPREGASYDTLRDQGCFANTWDYHRPLYLAVFHAVEPYPLSFFKLSWFSPGHSKPQDSYLNRLYRNQLGIAKFLLFRSNLSFRFGNQTTQRIRIMDE